MLIKLLLMCCKWGGRNCSSIQWDRLRGRCVHWDCLPLQHYIIQLSTAHCLPVHIHVRSCIQIQQQLVLRMLLRGGSSTLICDHVRECVRVRVRVRVCVCVRKHGCVCVGVLEWLKSVRVWICEFGCTGTCLFMSCVHKCASERFICQILGASLLALSLSVHHIVHTHHVRTFMYTHTYVHTCTRKRTYM